ncbi:MAG: peptidylprolyl isomerase [Monoglobaceae bacterium]
MCYGDCSFLDGEYAAFGKVCDGMETVDDFLKIERRGPEGGTPVEEIRIKKMTVI